MSLVFENSPGLTDTEIDFDATVPAPATDSVGMVGAAQWGPVMMLNTISTQGVLVDRFFKPNDKTYLSFFSATSALAWTSNLKFARVVGAAARNAASGGKGSGLKLDVNAQNGLVLSATIDATATGSGYVAGDVVTINDGISNAYVRITEVDNAGGVVNIDLLSQGSGYAAENKETTVLNSVRVLNEDEADELAYMPEIIGRYPGDLANGLMFSSARASEFDKWAFRDRFVVPPNADSLVFVSDGKNAAFTLPAEHAAALPDDAIVTANGFVKEEGSDPGNYQLVNGALVFNEDVETFVVDPFKRVFNLANTAGIDATNATVTVAGVELKRYEEGVGRVPQGYFRINNDETLEIGVGYADFSGDGVTKVFTVPDAIISASQARVVADGSTYEVVTDVSVTPLTATQVLLAPSGGNTTLTFLNAPANGISNVFVEHGFPFDGTTIEATYGAPAAQKDGVKVFWNQNELHAVVVDKEGKWTGVKDSILERYDFLGTIKDELNFDGSVKYYVDAINRRSRYIYMTNEMFAHVDKVLSGGVSADVYGVDLMPGDVQTGYNLFANDSRVEIAHLVIPYSDVSTIVWVNSNIALKRRDLVTYWSPPLATVLNNVGREKEDILEWAQAIPRNTFSHMDDNWKRMYDRFNDKYRWIPHCADSAGMYAWTHANEGFHKSAAGFNRGVTKNAVRLAWNSSKPERDELFPTGINSVVEFDNVGPVLFGDKTFISIPTRFEAMNIRWTFIFLRKAINRLGRRYFFENNDEFTRNRFKNEVNPFLSSIKGANGIEDYRVFCNERNNGPAVRKAKKFVGRIVVVPKDAIRNIHLEFVAAGPDVAFEELEQ